MRQGLLLSTCDGPVDKALDLQSLASEYEQLESVKIFESFYDGNAFDELLDEVQSRKLDTRTRAYASYDHDQGE